MTRYQLKNLENKLWKAADDLRANSKLTASEYSFPVLGIIFLRHAYNRFVVAKEEIEKSLPSHPQRGKRAVSKNDFLNAKAIFLPENAQWKTIANLKTVEDPGEFLNNAMRSIEEEYEVLNGVLPKEYTLFEKDLLFRLIRIFNDEELNNVTGDVFGRIYEYFLNKFAMTGAQEGGEFFTPPSLVNAIVNIIEPNHGTVFDPACGSAGMFVQSAHFIEEELLTDASKKVTFYGQEKADTNTKLAKMNMAVHGLDANILQGNSFYEDHHELVGQCDFVMANPPFNVDGVDKGKDSVKNDRRLPFGLPNNDNANYLWIQYFYSYLNDSGRAGFVMASSASDAGHSEKLIRQKLVETGAVDVMVSIGTKFFYTRSLPCSLWFFDKAKAKDEIRADQTLMLDLRDVYRKVSTNLHDFTEEQLKNIHALVAMYRGDNSYFEKVLTEYKTTAENSLTEAQNLAKQIEKAESIEHEFKTFSAENLKEEKRLINNAVKAFVNDSKELLRSEDYKKHKDKKERLQKKIAEVERLVSKFTETVNQSLYFTKETAWLTQRFPEGKYVDVSGLCKVVDKEAIADNDYSLTAGRYVGVAPVEEDEDFDFETRMGEIKLELQGLNEEAAELANQIQANFNELGL
ncbi:type I restriction enzyme M protein [Salegentibacter sp. 24]|uniref:type I restriction-modification system subunit M n=1 Tax=Salegentibacter sp. 24 TaxID=2183986 RepID=UPI00105BDAD6|nr:class I SAM-dependent DNA methyltransferase [Salegentibacter sp. 24]TDN80365.1 type I restriction enzyme M protein [Salegentibacter sp. 24]